MLNIKVFSDFACPFCYIAANIIDKLKEDGLEIDVEWCVYEMRPEAPLEGLDTSKKLSEIQLEKTEKLYEMLDKLGKPYGLKYSNKYMRFNTNRAHLAGEYAKTQNKYDEFSKEAFKTYFEYSKNLADKTIINEIASKIGLDVEEMNSQVDQGKFDDILLKDLDLIEQHKVEGAPTFIINDKNKLTGVRPYEQFKRSLLAMMEE